MTIGPTKVKACTSVLFTEGNPEVEITFLPPKFNQFATKVEQFLQPDVNITSKDQLQKSSKIIL